MSAPKIVKIEEDALEELFGLAEEAMGYVPQYFLEKWEMHERLQAVKVAYVTTPSHISDEEYAELLGIRQTGAHT